jgi:hyaluronan synthase
MSRTKRGLELALRAFSFVYLIAIIVGIVVYKALFIKLLLGDPFFAVYGISVAVYILSRFVLSLFYRAGKDQGIEPRVAIVMPGFNEEEAIGQSLRSLLQLDYPADKLELVAVNDGSFDRTLVEMRKVEAEANGRVHVISFPENRGKRAAMAAGIRATDAEIIAFVDSDSMLEPDALRVLVQHFAKPKVGAVAGHAEVLNIKESWMSRMQAVRYFVAFKVLKAAESVFSSVTCCSGCSPPTGARRSCPTSRTGSTSASSAAPRPSATTARSRTTCCATGRSRTRRRPSRTRSSRPR